MLFLLASLACFCAVCGASVKLFSFNIDMVSSVGVECWCRVSVLSVGVGVGWPSTITASI